MKFSECGTATGGQVDYIVSTSTGCLRAVGTLPRPTDLSQPVFTKLGMVVRASGLMLVCSRLRSRFLRSGLWRQRASERHQACLEERIVDLWGWLLSQGENSQGLVLITEQDDGSSD